MTLFCSSKQTSGFWRRVRRSWSSTSRCLKTCWTLQRTQYSPLSTYSAYMPFTCRSWLLEWIWACLSQWVWRNRQLMNSYASFIHASRDIWIKGRRGKSGDLGCRELWVAWKGINFLITYRIHKLCSSWLNELLSEIWESSHNTLILRAK